MKLAAAFFLGMTLCAGSIVAAPAQTALAPKGASLDGELQQTLDSGKNHDGDTFTLITKDSFFHHTALKGATVEGHVESVSPASATHKATMTVIFDDVKLPDGSTAPIRVKIDSLQAFEPHTHHMRDAALIVGGAVTGHIVSKKTHHGGGTLAGAAAGFALASSLKSNVVVKRGTYVRLKLLDPVMPGATS